MNQATDQTSGATLIRILRPSLVILCGPSACGKSTFARRHFRPTQVISSDWARALVCDDDRDQRFNMQAFDLVHYLVNQRLALNRLCVVDSTALTPQARKDLLLVARNNQVPTTLITFNVPLETCLERDERRERPVGRVVIDRQYQSFELSKATLQQEGFDQIVGLENGSQDRVRFEILFRPIQRLERGAHQSARRDRPGPPSNGRQDRRNDRKDVASVQPIVQTPTQGATPVPTESGARPVPPLPLAAKKVGEIHPAAPTTLTNPAVRPAPVPVEPERRIFPEGRNAPPQLKMETG